MKTCYETEAQGNGRHVLVSSFNFAVCACRNPPLSFLFLSSFDLFNTSVVLFYLRISLF